MHQISGTVSHGEQLGRKLGWPTINIITVIPKTIHYGVYAGFVQLTDGTKHQAAIIVGVPKQNNTFAIEAHIFNFDEEIYNQNVTFFLHEYIRPLEKCNSFEELKEKISQDIKLIQEWHTNNS